MGVTSLPLEGHADALFASSVSEQALRRMRTMLNAAQQPALGESRGPRWPSGEMTMFQANVRTMCRLDHNTGRVLEAAFPVFARTLREVDTRARTPCSLGDAALNSAKGPSLGASQGIQEAEGRRAPTTFNRIIKSMCHRATGHGRMQNLFSRLVGILRKENGCTAVPKAVNGRGRRGRGWSRGRRGSRRGNTSKGKGKRRGDRGSRGKEGKSSDNTSKGKASEGKGKEGKSSEITHKGKGKRRGDHGSRGKKGKSSGNTSSKGKGEGTKGTAPTAAPTAGPTSDRHCSGWAAKGVKGCPSGYKPDSNVSSKPFRAGRRRQVWIAHRGCIPRNKCNKKKGGEDCNWHGEFASCSSNPNSEDQRDEVLKAALDFQDKRVDRVDDILGYRRRRIGGSSSDAYSEDGVSGSTPVGQVMLAADAALRKVIANLRSRICVGKIPTDPKEIKACDVDTLKTDGNDKPKLLKKALEPNGGKWAEYMKNDHGIAFHDGQFGKADIHKRGQVNVLTIHEDQRKSSYSVIMSVNIKNKDGGSSPCNIKAGWEVKVYEKCKCSPFSYVYVRAYEGMIKKTLECLAENPSS